MGKFKDLTGLKINKNLVLYRVDVSLRTTFWMCRCDCGNVRRVNASSLKKGVTVGCRQCYSNPKNVRHGQAKRGFRSRTYVSWREMKTRCTNTKVARYENYGGRGISVCKRWQSSFDNFFKDMGVRPEGTSLDRINSNKSYYKKNCRWATTIEQGNNTRRNRFIEIRGERLTLTQAARKYGVVSHAIIRDRFYKLKWDIEKCFFTPKMDTNKNLRQNKI